jgi:CheY-like chemotaxis protein
VIDDEPGVLRVACLALEAGGYIVVAYADGRGGIGARVIEMASRVRLAFAAACPDASLIGHIATALMPGP